MMSKEQRAELRRLAENGVALGPAFTHWPDPEIIVELLDDVDKAEGEIQSRTELLQTFGQQIDHLRERLAKAVAENVRVKDVLEEISTGHYPPSKSAYLARETLAGEPAMLMVNEEHAERLATALWLISKGSTHFTIGRDGELIHGPAAYAEAILKKENKS